MPVKHPENPVIVFFMRPLLLISMLVGAFNCAWAQTYGNEWINYNQTYFRIPVAQKGLYRLSADDLQRAGVPLANVDATALQLFFRGKEQAVFVQGEADKRIGGQDFIEFFGQANDGVQDSLLYIPTTAQPHKYFNLYTDTTAYFLTWRLDGQLGKRMASYDERNTANLAPEAFHVEELLLLNFKNQVLKYSEGLIYPIGASAGPQFAHGDFGEGWTGEDIPENKVIVQDLPLENAVLQGPKPRLEIMLAGRYHRPRRIEIRAGTRFLDTVNFDNYYTNKYVRELEFGDLGADKLSVSTVSRSRNGQVDFYAVSYHRLNYAQRLDARGKTFKQFNLVPKVGGRSYVEITNAPAEARLYDVTDPANAVRVGAITENGTLKAVVTNSTNGRNLILVAGFDRVVGLQRMAFRNIDPTKANFLIVSHKALMKPVGGLNDPVRAYAEYRASAAGGKYDTLTVDMDLLMNQFNYGEFSALAVRRFTQFMVDKGSPKFMFIIGRTQQVHFTRFAKDRYLRDMVPTFGWPGSDNMFSAGLKGSPPFVPAVPVGRLWTDSPQTVLDYLNKVKEHESASQTQSMPLWRKNILHLSGGISPFELRLFKNYLDDFRRVAKNKFLGANVTTITKNTDDPVELIGLADQINKGAGIVTLFGHSSLSVTDIDIGFATNDVLGYRNKGRYPLVYASGCVLGNFTFGARTYPIDWVGAPDRGAILFLAHANLAYSYSLKSYGDVFYQTLLGDTTYFNKPFGLAHREMIRKFLRNDKDPIAVSDAQQMVLQGDPAVVLFPVEKPDFQIENGGLLLTTKTGIAATALADSVVLRAVVANAGVFKGGNLSVLVRRSLPNGNVIGYSFERPAVAFRDTLILTLKNDRNQTGLNRFEVLIDPDNKISESNKTNNVATLGVVIQGVGATPLLPNEFGIVGSLTNNAPTANLVAQAVENGARSYLFEIDSVSTYSSAFKKTQTLTADLLPSWTPALADRDSTTYFWRIRYADRPAGDDNIWVESSFTHIRNAPEGWTQRAGGQLIKNQNVGLKVNPANAQWVYDELQILLKATVAGAHVGAFAQGYKLSQLALQNLLVVAAGNCKAAPGVVAVAFDRATMRPYSVFQQNLCGNPPFVTNFLPDVNIINNQLMETYFANVKPGDFIVLMSSGDIAYTDWKPATLAAIRSLGVSDNALRGLKPGAPFLFAGQKGRRAAAVEVIATAFPESLQTVSLDDFALKSTTGQGNVTTALIGPASAWGQVSRRVAKTGGQNETMSVVGVALDGRESLLFDNVSAARINIDRISSSQFPYLKLQLKLSNTDVNTNAPAQLRNWLVTYKPVAEGVAFANLKAGFERQEGERFAVLVSFKNISEVAFTDSIVVRQTLSGANGRTITNQSKIKPLKPNEQADLAVDVQTVGRAGDNRLVVSFNPRLQAEQYYTNNAVDLPFTVLQDRAAPILEVTFDGQRIADNDVVAPAPVVLVRLKDENRILFKTDTSGINLFLQRPGASNFVRISLRSAAIKITPASTTADYLVAFAPGTLPEGNYALRVQGADASGNLTGVYIVQFRVKNAAEVLDFKAYPNPMDVSARFAYQVSGSEKPDECRVEIYELGSGKVVRILTAPTRIGTTEIPWDGTNAFGAALPSGAFGYRLVLRRNGQAVPAAAGVVLNGKISIQR